MGNRAREVKQRSRPFARALESRHRLGGMQLIAAPMVDGMVTSTVLSLGVMKQILWIVPIALVGVAACTSKDQPPSGPGRRPAGGEWDEDDSMPMAG